PRCAPGHRRVPQRDPGRTIFPTAGAPRQGGRGPPGAQDRAGFLQLHRWSEEITLVASHVSGSWWTPSSPADATELVDASTGAALASVSVEGIDLFAAVEYGRSVGQRGLQALTFHQRALKLKELAQYLNGKRDELYEVSM